MLMKSPGNAIAGADLATLLIASSSVPSPSHADDLCRYDPQAPDPMPAVHIGDLGGIKKTVAGLAGTYGADKVLIVFDIDNTLLTSVQDLGSDAWFKWQNAIRERPSCQHVRVSVDFGGLLQAQYLAYSIGDMRPTQADTAKIIRLLGDAGHGVMALTARGPEIRSPTVRELREDGIAFTNAPVCRAGSEDAPSLCVKRGFISSETILAVAETVLTEREREMLGAQPRLISYADGVMMVAGQNKGLMLRLLLASSRSTFEAIVFVDDGADNVIDVEEAFASDDTPLVKGFWYTAFEAANEQFWSDAARQDGTVQAWRTVSSALCRAVGTFCQP